VATKSYVTLAEMTSAASGARYDIRRDSDGKVYCYNVTEGHLCKSWQFNRSMPKTCKHIVRYHTEMAKPGPTAVQQVVAAQQKAQTTVKAAAAIVSRATHWDSAAVMTSAMLDEARVYVNSVQRDQMIRVLAEKLAAFVPVVPVERFPVAVEHGVRLITFDD
jgi:hypothetical protein